MQETASNTPIIIGVGQVTETVPESPPTSETVKDKADDTEVNKTLEEIDEVMEEYYSGS